MAARRRWCDGRATVDADAIGVPVTKDRQKLVTLIVIAISLVLVIAAERDIQSRPASEVRGNKLLWRIACLNALGAINYFGWGRRPTAQ
jgi:hypothetical protein